MNGTPEVESYFDCNCTDFRNNPAILSTKLGIVAALTATLLALFTAAKMMYDKVEIAHPVFAVVFQELVFLCASATLAFLLLLPMMVDHLIWWIYLSSTIGTIAMQFHQVSWLLVTSLRYYLLVRVDPSKEIDMKKLRRRSLSLAWVAIPLTFMCQIPWWATAVAMGWPDIHLNHMDPMTMMLAYGVGHCLANLPDYVSIVIYVKMMRHFSIAIQPEDNNAHQGAVAQEDVAAEEAVQVVPVQEPQQQETLKSVMRALKTHISVSMVDFVPVVASIIFVNTFLSVILVNIQFLLSFWIPVMVVKKNCKQLNGMASYFCIQVC